jgi:hypothetical protein
MRLFIGIILGAALAYGATAYANSSHRARIPAPRCENSSPTRWVCAFPDPKSITDIYALKVPGLDLTCDLKGPPNSVSEPETLECNRSSHPENACERYTVGGKRVPDVWYGSLTLYVAAYTVIVANPGQCTAVRDPYGYDVAYGRSQKFWRLP